MNNWTTQKYISIKNEGRLSLFVLHKLRLAGKKGITHEDFAKGYALTSRIAELAHFVSIQRVPYGVFDRLGKRVGTGVIYKLAEEYPTTKRGFGTKGIQLRMHKGDLQYKIGG